MADDLQSSDGIIWNDCVIRDSNPRPLIGSQKFSAAKTNHAYLKLKQGLLNAEDLVNAIKRASERFPILEAHIRFLNLLNLVTGVLIQQVLRII